MTTKAGVSDAAGNVSDVAPEETVTKEAHNRLLAQRKADQARAKAAEEELAKVRGEREAEVEAKLAAEKQFQVLAESEKKKREAAEARVAELTKSQTLTAKRSALAEAIGGVKKPEFLRFADLERIQLNADGTIDPDSLEAEANKFRETYPELLIVKSAGKLPTDAARDYTPPAPKAITDMSISESEKAYRALRATS